MEIKLDNFELIKRVQESPDAPVKEIRSVFDVHVGAERSIVELKIQGSGSSVPQDMGREPIRISLRGEVWGVDAKATIEKLLNKYTARTPFHFSSDIATVAEVNSVMIKDLVLEEAAGATNHYVYHITLREHKEAREPVEEQASSQEGEAEEEAEKQSEIDDIRGKILGPDGNPARDVTVLVKGPTGEVRVQTNDEGFYEVLDLPEGKYHITVEGEGYEDVEGDVEIKKGGEGY